jgi:hypothetical protein
MIATCTNAVCQLSGDRCPRAVRRQAAGHAPDGEGDDGRRRDLQPVQPAGIRRVADRVHAVGEGNERDRRGQREAQPGEERARQAGTKHADAHAGLAAGRPR